MEDWAADVASREAMPTTSIARNSAEGRARATRYLLLLLLALAFSAPLPHPQPVPNSEARQRWEHVGSVPVLHLCGEPYEMGLGQGSLLRQRLQQFVQDYLYSHVILERNAAYAWLVAYARLLESQLPLDVLQELQGIADGANLPYQDVLLLNLIPELVALTGRLPSWNPSPSLFSLAQEGSAPWPGSSLCSSFAAWGEATEDGQLLIGYNLEEDVANAAHPYLVVMVRHPSHGNAFVSLGLAGTVGVWAGMNEQGIAVALSSAPSADVAQTGLPLPLLLRRVLESSGDLPTAINILLAGKRLCGGNVVLADGKAPEAVAIEMSAHRQAVLEADTQGGTLARTNHFVTPELAMTQQDILPERDRAASQARLDRLQTLLEVNYGWLGKEKGVALLMDTYTTRQDNVSTTVHEPRALESILFQPGQLMMQMVQNGGNTPSRPFLNLTMDLSQSQCLESP